MTTRAKREKTRRAAPRHAGDEIGAAELARRVAESLKRLRRERALSLDELSARSGVSRAALSQVEGGRTNPTLAVLWKIAVGLEIPFHDLVGAQGADEVRIQRARGNPPLLSADGRLESTLLSPGGSSGDVEIYELRLRPKGIHSSDPHNRGTTETLIVLTGAVRLRVADQSYDLGAGDSAFFRADVAHAYENRGTREARCIDVIRYVRT